MGAPQVGRLRELRTLTEFVADATQGPPRLALVSGEAGIGKSRLVTVALRKMSTSDVKPLVGHCLDLRTGRVPYAPLSEALGNGPLAWWQSP